MNFLNLFRIRKLKIQAEREEREMSFDSSLKTNVKISFCFLHVSTQINDTEEDEKDDNDRYNKYKRNHPCDGTAIWKNERKGKQYIYTNGEEKIYQISSNNNSAIEDEMKAALNVLHSQEAKDKGFGIVHGYDYAFIKLIIDRQMFNGSGRLSNTMPGFRELVTRLGFDDICDVKTLNKYYSAASGKGFDLIYSDSKGETNIERHRRNQLIQTFTEQMREIRGA